MLKNALQVGLEIFVLLNSLSVVHGSLMYLKYFLIGAEHWARWFNSFDSFDGDFALVKEIPVCVDVLNFAPGIPDNSYKS